MNIKKRQSHFYIGFSGKISWFVFSSREVIGHLVGCGACRDFLRQSETLQGVGTLADLTVWVTPLIDEPGVLGWFTVFTS